MTIYERLAVMSVSHSRVTDQRTLPGVVAHSLSPERWAAVEGRDRGCVALFVDAQSTGPHFRDNIAVFITRFSFDHGVNPDELIDHAYVDARALERWSEESTQRWPAQGRHSGWALISGRYRAGAENLFVASAYVVHERGNVGYLVQTTATVRDGSAEYADVVAAVQTVNFVD